MRIDPWSSQSYADYARLREEFGIEPFDATGLPDQPPLFRRGLIFGHRGFGAVRRAIERRERFAVMSGLMPSGPMHLGHKMVLDQSLYFHSLGADLFLAVADIEAYAARNIPLEKARRLAEEIYIPNYIALGLPEERVQIYFQSRRQAVKDLAYLLGRRTNLTEMKAIYGFEDSVNMAHLFSPLVQVGDILHVQLPDYGGPRPTLVPVGVDQDPHIRLTRDLAGAHRLFSVEPQKEGGIGVFARGEEDPAPLLKAAKNALKDRYGRFDESIPYRALFVRDAKNDEIPGIDRALLKIEPSLGGYGFHPPASTYHRFMSGLTGGKMSSSKPETHISLNEPVKEAMKKVMGAVTGGGATVEEHRRLGGKPEVCPVYELYMYHLASDDADLQEVNRTCRSGERLCGNCKKEAAGLLESFLKDFEEKRKAAADRAKAVVRDD